MRLIPFTVTIPSDQQDRHLASKLQQELAGILNWAIEGCLLWRQEGLEVPSAVKAATDGYRREMDQLGRFLEECCVQEPSAAVRASDLYQAYHKWSQDNAEEPLTQTGFGGELRRRGFEKKRDSRGYRYLGLRLSVQNG
jgi:putative DNA primase/helicase